MAHLGRLFLGIVLLVPTWGWSSNEPHPAGARAAGMAGAGVTLSDIWSVTNNIAGITALSKPALGVYTENRFGIKAFSTVSLQGVYSFGTKGSAGLELSRFGDKLYNEQTMGLGYAHRIGPVSLGVKATMVQIHLEELGSQRTVALSAGGQSEIIPNLVFGAHVYNLNQARLASFQDERLPTVMQAGLAYKSGKNVFLTAQTEKTIDLPADFKAGLEYKIIDKLALRTGFATGTQRITAGAGFQARAFQIDYALGGHAALGVSNHLSVAYLFK